MPSATSLDEIAARLGATVRADAGDERLHATVLIGRGGPVLTLNEAILGTEIQEEAVLWALDLIDAGVLGFHLRRADA